MHKQYEELLYEYYHSIKSLYNIFLIKIKMKFKHLTKEDFMYIFDKLVGFLD